MPTQLLPQLLEQMTQGVVILEVDHPESPNQTRLVYANDAGRVMFASIVSTHAGDDTQPIPVTLPADLAAKVQRTCEDRQRRSHRTSALEQGMTVETEIIPLASTHMALLLHTDGDTESVPEVVHAPEILESVLLNAPIGLAFLNKQFRYVRLNQALADMNGAPVAAHLGRTMQDVIPETAGAVEPLVAHVFQTGESLTNLEVTGQTPAVPGVERTWLTGFYPIRVDQEIDYVGIIVTEITQRKLAEAALQASEARYRRTFENAAVGIAHVGLDGAWLRVNQRICDIVGRTREELLTSNFQAITHADDLDTDLGLYAQLIRGDIESYRMEKRYFHRDGHIVWVNLTTAMERTADGTPLYCISVVEDITATKIAEARLRVLAHASQLLAASMDTSETLQALAELMVPELADWCTLHIAQPDGNIARVALAHSGAGQAVAARVQRTRVPDPGDRNGVAQVMRTGQSMLLHPHRASGHDDGQVTTPPDGLCVPSATACIIVPLQTRGQTLGALTLSRTTAGQRYTRSDLAFVEEVAQRAALAVDNAALYAAARRAEAELRAANRGLEERIAARTRELERSNRELQDFAYVASHDLQEPLRKVMAFGDRLQQKYAAQLDSTATDYIERMQQAAGRMQRLINDLLALSRVTTGGHAFEVVDLAQTIADVVDDLDAAVLESGGTVIVEALPPAMGDPSQIHQLFQNLIANALKFRRPGIPPKVHVRVCTEPAEPPSFVCIEVADNGIGIAPQYAERIFQPFQRLHGRDVYAGSGMGLAICRRIVERHGGRVTVTGVPNIGATFRVTLPAV